MRRKTKNVKRVLCVLLACALTMLPVAPASAATARATTMKLEKTEGTVSLKTQNGSARKITNGMRLYNGNTLSTGKHSYAYVSLDSSKAVKLDQSATATLRQSGKELELLVKDGKLFFNVSKPLTDKESMNVRTSTMVTGIRGTCGVVEYVSAQTSKLYLLEGTVTLGSGENATTIQGGQTATVVLPPKQEAGGTDKPGTIEKPSIQVEKMTEEMIPPVALQEIVNDTALQEKIEKTTELKVEKIEKAFEQFQKEEAERIEQEKKEQEKEKEDKNKEDKKEEDKKEEDKKEDQKTDNGSQNSSGSSDSGSSNVPSTPVTPDPPTTPDTPKEPTKTTLSGTAITFEQLSKALSDHDEVTLEGVVKLGANDQLLIPAAKTLVVNGSIEGEGTISLGAGSTLDNRGVIQVANIKDLHTAASDEMRCVRNAGNIEVSDKYLSNAEYVQTDQAMLTCLSASYSLSKPLMIVSGLRDSVSDDTSVDNRATQLFAQKINKMVENYLSERSEKDRLSVSIHKDFTVDSDVTLRGSRNGIIYLSTYEGAIHVVPGATLTLDRIQLQMDKEDAADCLLSLEGGDLRITGNGEIYIANRTKNCAVKVSDGSRIFVDTASFSIRADYGVKAMIQGMEVVDDVLSMPECVKLKQGEFQLGVDQTYLTCKKNWEISLDGEVTQENIEEAFRFNRRVHIQKDAKLQLDENAILVIPSGNTLQFWGTHTIPKTTTIQVGDGYDTARLCVPEEYTLSAGNIEVKKTGCLENHGTLSCVNLTGSANGELINNHQLNVSGLIYLDSSAKYWNNGETYGVDIENVGSSVISNTKLISLSGSYISDRSDAYSGSETSLLISNQESTAINNQLFAYGYTQASTDIAKTVLQYYYATSKNDLVTKYMNLLKEAHPDIQWEPQQDTSASTGI